MANGVSGITAAFREGLLNGMYAFGTSVVRANTDADSFKMALYLATGSISTATGAYTSSGEVNAGSSGYDAGGKAVTNAVAPTTDTNVAIWTPSAVISWTSFTSGGAFDLAMLYNDTRSDLSVAVFNLGSQNVTAGTFTLSMPSNAAATALIRIS